MMATETSPGMCPLHDKPYRIGRDGGFFCANKMDDGTWCKMPKKEPINLVDAMVKERDNRKERNKGFALLAAVMRVKAEIDIGILPTPKTIEESRQMFLNKVNDYKDHYLGMI